jgi:hypothetical protein
VKLVLGDREPEGGDSEARQGGRGSDRPVERLLEEREFDIFRSGFERPLVGALALESWVGRG